MRGCSRGWKRLRRGWISRPLWPGKARHSACILWITVPRIGTIWRRINAFEVDDQLRRALIGSGIYPFPLATKQWSISAAHTTEDIDYTLEQIDSCLSGIQIHSAATPSG